MTDQRRIILWTTLRSVSTAFMRAMMNKTKTKVFLEPYSLPYCHGPEKLSKRDFGDDGINKSVVYTFNYIKEELEQLYPEYCTLFVKDFAFYLIQRYGSDTFQHLPDGYIHTFLIRNPAKTVPSLYKISCQKETGWPNFEREDTGIEELYQMFQQVTEKLQPNVIVVDADDLIQNPEMILKQYCKQTGIEFQESMLHWDENDQNSEIFTQWQHWFKDLFATTSFISPSTGANGTSQKEPLPQEIQTIIDECMEYYWKMYEFRLKP